VSGIVYLSMLSAACRAGLPELCTDASCENYVHDGDDLEPLDLSPEADDASVLHAEARFESSRDD
jgi:hypothetical protein